MKKQSKAKKLKHTNETVVLLTPVNLQGVQGGFCTQSDQNRCQICSSSVP